MARKAEGWKLSRDPRTGNFLVRFTHAGQPFKLSTRTADRGRALEEAAAIYADVTGGGGRRRLTAPPLLALVAEWLASREGGVSDEQWQSNQMHMTTHLIPHFKTLEGVTERGVARYVEARLRKVRASTVKKELSTLRVFLKWCRREEHLRSMPHVPNPAPRAIGTPARTVQRVDLTPAQAEAVLAAMPERTNRGNPARAFFRVMWETGLRPSTLQQIKAPGDYSKGSDRLIVRKEIDKARFGRELPLSTLAREALDSVCPKKGLIFGEVDYRTTMIRAAKAAGLPEHLQEFLSYSDFRHGFLTDMGSVADLPTLQYLAGHKHAITTSKYVHPRAEKAAAALERRGR